MKKDCLYCNKTFNAIRKNIVCCSTICKHFYRLTQIRKWKIINKEKVKEDFQKWTVNNRDKRNASYKKWREANKNYINVMRREYITNNINEKLAHNLRSRLYDSIKGKKIGSAVKDLGCSIEELKKYLESQFQLGMTWDNYGKWHIDHIEPLSKFNLSDKEQFMKANHYTNLQPLWAKDNLRKGNR